MLPLYYIEVLIVEKGVNKLKMIELTNPIILGILASFTVFLGAITLPMLAKRLGKRGIGALQALSGGILAYLALEVGESVSEYIEELATLSTIREFLIASLLTTVVLFATWAALSYSERWGGLDTLVRLTLLGSSTGLSGTSNTLLYLAGRTSLIVAIGLGLHNIGEGFAIAAALLKGSIASAIIFTIGFAVHNYTEGFAITGPLAGESKKVSRIPLKFLLLISAIAALPTLIGASAYYVAPPNELVLALLSTMAEASLVYALIRVNLSALGRLGGPSSLTFWFSLGAGVALTYTMEAVVLLSVAS